MFALLLVSANDSVAMPTKDIQLRSIIIIILAKDETCSVRDGHVEGLTEAIQGGSTSIST